MTERAKSVSEEIEFAMRNLDTADAAIAHTSSAVFVAVGEAKSALERALKQIQRARCDAYVALDHL